MLRCKHISVYVLQLERIAQEEEEVRLHDLSDDDVALRVRCIVILFIIEGIYIFSTNTLRFSFSTPYAHDFIPQANNKQFE